MTRLRIAILGAGRIGAVHAANAAASPAIQLVGVADAIPEAADALAQSVGAPVRQVEELIAAPDVDAVLIATSTDTHAGLAEQAAAAGKAIFCEKPIDLDIGRARACLAAVEAAGVPFVVGFNRRFDPSFAALKRRLDAGEIGAVETITITSRDPAPPPLAYIERSGGLFRDMTIHDLDMACWLLGETPTSVFAAGASLVDPEIGAAGDIDTAALTLAFPSGRICQIANSRRAVYGYDQRIEVHGAAGMLQADNRRETTVTRASATGYVVDPAQTFFLERYAEAYRAELDAFAAAVLGGDPAEPAGADGLRALILADAADRSRREARSVAIDRIDP